MAVETGIDQPAEDTDRNITEVVRLLLHGRTPPMTQLELGMKIGLGKNAMTDRMQLRKGWEVREVVALSRELGFPVSVFLDGVAALLAQTTRYILEGLPAPTHPELGLTWGDPPPPPRLAHSA